MSATPCVPCCTTPQSVNIPGTQGSSAVTTLTSSFVVPAVGSTVAAVVSDTSWMFASGGIGTNVWVAGGNFMVTAVNSSTGATLMFLGLDNDTLIAGNTAAAGSVVAAGIGGYKLSVALSALANFTDNSGGTPGSTVAAGVGISHLIIPLPSLVTGLTGSTNLLTTYGIGYRFKLLAFDFVTNVLGTGAGASQNFSLAISAVNVTGGALNVTLASTAALGQVTLGSAITATNIGTSVDTLTIKQVVGTVFTAGAGYFVIRIQNMDDADTLASIASKFASITAFLGKP